MEIRPASLDQIALLRTGDTVVVEDDVGNVAKDLQAIDPSLELIYSENTGRFAVLQNLGNKKHLVTTAEECDQRLVNRVREISSPDYDVAAEMDRLDKEAKREEERQHDERVGEAGERIAHALRKDLGEVRDSARSRKTWGKNDNSNGS